MSLKNLFENKQFGKVISNKSLSEMTSIYGVQNAGAISSTFEKYDLLLPNIDFSDPINFAKFGLAEKYYEDSIKKIAQTYPYDGSRKQKNEWRNKASYLDLYLFDNEYPRHTGSVEIGTNFGTSSVKSNGYYNTPARVEYIKIDPGLSTGSIFNSGTDRKSAFSFNSENGFCVEFWMKSNQWSADLSTASYQCVFHFGARASDLTSTAIFPSGVFSFAVLITGTSLVVGLETGTAAHNVTKTSAFSLSQWNHYAINVLSGGSVDIWKNGQKIVNNSQFTVWPSTPVDLTLSGTIGAFSEITGTTWYAAGARLGWNKFSGSLDDFRFWRRSRTNKEIAENWFDSVDGGYDSDEQLLPEMGFYYKFNESTVATASYDARVLDYSGRKNNATWIGYVSGSRVDYSPMTNEFRDPILHLSSSRVFSFLYSKTLEGRNYDVQNNGTFISNFPHFFEDEDENDHWLNLSQIIASMFDRLWLQIQSLTSIKDNGYFNSGSFSSDILVKLINSTGLSISNILDDYSLREIIEQKSDTFNYENSIEDIKQVIYKNIYNNLIYILKAKGTEKSIKSVFRSFGIDDEVLKIKTYAKDSEIEIDGSKRVSTVRRKNFLDLSGYTDGNNMNCVVFNQYIPTITGSVSHFTASGDHHINRTIESTIVFPRKLNIYDPNFVRIPNSTLTSSLFGCNQITGNIGYGDTDSTFESNSYGFGVYAVQRSVESKDAKFVFIYTKNKARQIYTETNWFPNVYDNSKWTFAVRYAQSGTQDLESIQIEALSGSDSAVLNFFGVNELAGNMIYSFSFSTEMTDSSNSNLFLAKTKLFLGADRTNFTGNLLYPCQAKFAYLRMWQDYLNDEDVYAHAYDAQNYGIHSGSWNYGSETNIWNSTGYYNFIPRAESLMINWDFEREYIPDSNGIFTVTSFRSRSPFSGSPTGQLSTLGPSYSAIGWGFNSGSTVIDKNYVIEQKNKAPTDYYSSDEISLIDSDAEFFGRKIKPIEYFYTIENSIYAAISEEMLHLFSSVNEFNNLFGHPIERNRVEYKNLKVMRNLFFSRVQNSNIDIEKYISYYRWIDDSISKIVSKLFPFSANLDADIKNMVESHVLERNKYYWPPEIITEKSIEPLPVGIVRSIFRRSNFIG